MTFIEVFVVLQVLDFVTTLVGLHLGSRELNPIVAWLMQVTQPAIGLLVAKIVGFVLGGLFIWKQKVRLIQRINYFFAALVFWNAIQLLLIAART